MWIVKDWRRSRIVDRESFANIEEILETLIKNAEKINHHGKCADSIVRSMMQHARGVSDQRELAGINHLLDEAVNLTYHGMRANEASFNITIEKDYDETIGKLEIVPQDISRVFLNIVNNACYAAHQKARVGEGESGRKGDGVSGRGGGATGRERAKPRGPVTHSPSLPLGASRRRFPSQPKISATKSKSAFGTTATGFRLTFATKFLILFSRQNRLDKARG